ncbi:MAG TPA: hypothetical protein VLH38_06045 [Patescibacteria group bacterium]|nr:hypothetical protein [Patescibacteria group bacterium]
MSLTKEDLSDIRIVINEVFEALSTPRFDGLEGRMDSLDGHVGSLDGKVDGFMIETNQHLMHIDRHLDSIDGKLSAIEEDIKELYLMIAGLQKSSPWANKKFTGLSPEQKLLAMHSELLKLANEMGVQLPTTK